MSDHEFLVACVLNDIDRTGTFLLGCMVGACLTATVATLLLVVS